MCRSPLELMSTDLGVLPVSQKRGMPSFPTLVNGRVANGKPHEICRILYSLFLFQFGILLSEQLEGLGLETR